MTGGAFPTAFELSYDEQRKTLYATLRVKLIPVDLVKADIMGKPLLDANGQPQPIPYDTNAHRDLVAAGVGKSTGGCVMVYRTGTGPRFDIAIKKRQVEHALNAHKSTLILDGCSRNSSCGCRVSVVFEVDFLLAVNNEAIQLEDGKTIHKTIHLFPRAQRADANAWGEVNMYLDEQENWIDNPNETNVVAHECGHLFNFPDEYWAYGGSVHQRYIRDQDIDFAKGDQSKGKPVWQLEAKGNLMGEGANHVVQADSKQPLAHRFHPTTLNTSGGISARSRTRHGGLVMNLKQARSTTKRIITTLIATASIALGACAMTNQNPADTPSNDQGFSIRDFGGQRYASNGMAAWLSGRVRMGLFDTSGMKDFNGIGIIETRLSSDDLKEAKDIHRQMCHALSGNPSTGPQWFGEYTMFSIDCVENGQVVDRQGDLNRLPQELSAQVRRFEERIIQNYKNDARPLVKFEVALNNVQRQGHRFLVSVNFINRGQYAVSMQSPNQWREGFPYRLSIGGTRTEGDGKWNAELAGLPVENKAEFSIEEIEVMGRIDTYLSIPPGQSITLKFLAVPKDKVLRGTYRFSVLVDASLSAKGVYPSIGRVTFVSDRNKPTLITFDRDYPSTPEEWKDYEARQRAKLSSQPVAPGQTFAEAGHYRLVSASGQRSRFVFPFHEGAIAPEYKNEVDESGNPLLGGLHWLWEADRSRATYASQNKPCPREGRWIACEWQMGKTGADQYKLFPAYTRTFQAGDMLPVIQGAGGVVHPYAAWQWLGA